MTPRSQGPRHLVAECQIILNNNFRCKADGDKALDGLWKMIAVALVC
jgi:hypothetical protein